MEQYYKILQNNYTIALATSIQNKPHCVTLLHFSDYKTPAIFWISSENTKHSKNISINPNVSIAVTNTHRTGVKKVGLQAYGIACKYEGSTIDIFRSFLKKEDLELDNSGEYDDSYVNSYLDEQSIYMFFPKEIKIFERRVNDGDDNTDNYNIKEIISDTELNESIAILKSENYKNISEYYDMPKMEYKLHSHQTRMKMKILYGDVSIFDKNGKCIKVLTKGMWNIEEVGVEHTAIVGDLGCYYVVGD